MAHPRETLARGARTYFRSALQNNSRFAASDGIAAVDRIVIAWHTVASRAMSPSPTREDPGVDRPSSPVVSLLDEPVGADDSSSSGPPVDSAGDVPDVALDADGATADVPPSPAPPPPPSPPRRVRTPELKLRRLAPKNLTFWTRPRTPSPEPPTPPPEPEPVVESARSAPSPEPARPPTPDPNPILPLDRRLWGTRLMVRVHALRDAPASFGDVFVTVESGARFCETTPRTRPPSGSFPHETFWLEHDERDHEGPRGELLLTAVAEDDVGTHVELASVSVSVAELISTHIDDASVAESNARFASDVGDWLTMTPVDGSGYLGSMECRATLCLVDRDYVSPEDAAERLRLAIEALHGAADEAFHPDEIRAAFATITSALAIPTSRETRSARAFLDETFRLPRDDPDDGGEKGLTPLARAASRPTTQGAACVRALLDLGAGGDVACGARRLAPAHRAARAGASAAAAELFENAPGARRANDVDATDADGHTPLHVAILADAPGVVRALLRAGASTRVKSRTVPGFDAAHLAARLGDPGILAAVLVRHPDVRATCGETRSTAAHVAARHGHADAVGALLASGSDPERLDGAGRTPSAAAAERGRAAVVEEVARRCGDAGGGGDSRDGDGGRGGDRDGDEGGDRGVNGGTDPPFAASAAEWAAYGCDSATCRAVLASNATKSTEDWKRAAKVAVTRRAPLRVVRVLEGRAGGGRNETGRTRA